MKTVTAKDVILDLAEEYDANVIYDRDGDVAIQRTFYDDDSRRIIRHRSDPCDFHAPEAWLEADEVRRGVWVC